MWIAGRKIAPMWTVGRKIVLMWTAGRKVVPMWIVGQERAHEEQGQNRSTTGSPL